jgi:hypothetical protein
MGGHARDVDTRVGVNSVRSRVQRHRRPLRQGLVNNPPLLFQRPAPPRMCDQFRVKVLKLCNADGRQK